jgi:glutamine amidotransferase
MIGIPDYGAGNLFSLTNALKFLKYEFITSDKAEDLDKCGKIILPGVGAFRDAVNMLKQKNLFDYLKDVGLKKPFFGICLGMQLLFEKGYEFGETEGLGLISGSVKLMKVPYKIPHMGWNSLVFKKEDCPLFEGVKNGSYMYFVHSYAADTAKENIAASCDYGMDIPALVQKGNVYGAQFHPEKSGNAGLKILDNFCKSKE